MYSVAAKRTWEIRSENGRIGPLSSYGLAMWGMQGLLYPGDVLVKEQRVRWRAGYVPQLQPFIRNNGHLQRAKIWAIAGGKGGVGKSFLCAALATVLARHGKRAVVVDADFAGPNQHELFNVTGHIPSYWQAIRRGVSSFDRLAARTPLPNLRVVCAPRADNEAESANLMNKIGFIRALRNMDADVVLLDLGPRMEGAALDYFLTADTHVVVTTPETTAINNTVGFIQSAYKRKIDTVLNTLSTPGGLELDIQSGSGDMLGRSRHQLEQLQLPADPIIRRAVSSLNMNLVFNMVDGRDHPRPEQLLHAFLKQDLGLDVNIPGEVARHPEVHGVMRERRFLSWMTDANPVAVSLYEVVRRLLKRRFVQTFDNSLLTHSQVVAESKEMICGTWCHHWNDCEFMTPGYPCSVKNLN